MKDLNIYFSVGDFESSHKFDKIQEDSDLRKNLKEIENLLYTIQVEKNSFLLYDSEEIKVFIEQISLIAEAGNFYLTNPQMLFYEWLQNATDWRKSPKQNPNHYYFSWVIELQTAINQQNKVIAELVEQSLLNQTSLLVSFYQEAPLRGFHLAFKDFIPYKNENPIFVRIFHANNKCELENWLFENRTPRIFNLNPKHGENRQELRYEHGEEISPLRCTKEEAQQLLEKAVGELGERDLFNYDSVYQKFIIFKDENTPQNTFHGFHVEDENEVPQRIQQLLKSKN